MESYIERIEKAVSDFYKVPVNEIYNGHTYVYPFGVAKNTLMYLLYSNGVKPYDISNSFCVSTRLVYRKVSEVQEALRSDTKIRQDIDAINKMLNQ